MSYLEAATRGVLQKKVFLKISRKSQENTYVQVSFLIKLPSWGLQYGRLLLHICLAECFSKTSTIERKTSMLHHTSFSVTLQDFVMKINWLFSQIWKIFIYLVENILQFKGISQILCTAQKMKLSIKDFFSKCDPIRSFLRICHFTKKIFNGKLHFLCSVA